MLEVPQPDWYHARHGSLDRGQVGKKQKKDGRSGSMPGHLSLANILSLRRASGDSSPGSSRKHSSASRKQSSDSRLLDVSDNESASSFGGPSPPPERHRSSSGLFSRLLHALDVDDEVETEEALKKQVFKDFEEEKDDFEKLSHVKGGRLAYGTLESPTIQALAESLREWMNDVLAPRRVMVKSLFRDLRDGLILTELMEILTGKEASGIAKMQFNELGKMERLHQTLRWIDEELPRKPDDDCTELWNTQLIWRQDVIATLHLVLALARRYKCPRKLPTNVVVEVINANDHLDESSSGSNEDDEEEENEGADSESRADSLDVTGVVHQFSHFVTLTAFDEDVHHSAPGLPVMEDEDVFDRFFRQVPHKIQPAQDVLVNFTNKHLKRLNFHKPVTDFEHDFTDGVQLVYLLSVLGDFFVPLFIFKPHPATEMDRLINVRTAFQLMREADMKPAGNPQDIVDGNIKATMRILYAVFHKNKNC